MRTPLREAGPRDAREAVVFLHGNPGSSADWEPLLAALGDAPACGRMGRARIRRRGRPGRLPADGRRPRRLRRPGARRAGHRARARRRARLRRARGGSMGRRRPRPVRRRRAAVHRRASRLPLARAGAALAHAARSASCSWRRPRGRASACCCGAATSAGAAAALRRPHVRRLRPRRRATPCCGSTAPCRTSARRGSRCARALRALDRPALVLWGRHDPYLGVAHAERQRAAFPRADVRVLDRSGHWPFVDDPAAVTVALRAYLARHAAPAPRARRRRGRGCSRPPR